MPRIQICSTICHSSMLVHSPTCMFFVCWIYTSHAEYSCYNIANSMNPYWVFLLNLKEILPEAKQTLSVQNYVSLLAQQHNLLPKPEFSIGLVFIFVFIMFRRSIEQSVHSHLTICVCVCALTCFCSSLSQISHTSAGVLSVCLLKYV